MRKSSAWKTALALVLLASGLGAAQAITPAQVQAQIASGDVSTALNELQTAVQQHPNSGIAWYLMAEAQDAAGNESAARTALAKAEQISPGLPFANQQDVAALQAHVMAHHGGGGIGTVLMVVLGLVAMFVVIRLFLRSRPMPMGYGAPYDARPQNPYGPGYGPGPGPGYGQGGGGGGIMGSVVSGLAAGAGFAAGERIIDNLTGDRRGVDQNFDTDPLRDDGLQGNPGWDDGSNDGGGDSNDNW
jgi:hypothetical protein